MKRIVTIEDGFARDVQVFTGDPKRLETDGDWGDEYADKKYTTLYLGIHEGDDEDEIRSKVAENEGVHPDILTLTGFEGLSQNSLLFSRQNIRIDSEIICEGNGVCVYLEIWFDPEAKFGVCLIGDDSINIYARISKDDVRVTYVIKRNDNAKEDEQVYTGLTDAEKSLIREMTNEVNLAASGKTLHELLEECDR